MIFHLDVAKPCSVIFISTFVMDTNFQPWFLAFDSSLSYVSTTAVISKTNFGLPFHLNSNFTKDFLFYFLDRSVIIYSHDSFTFQISVQPCLNRSTTVEGKDAVSTPVRTTRQKITTVSSTGSEILTWFHNLNIFLSFLNNLYINMFLNASKFID